MDSINRNELIALGEGLGRARSAIMNGIGDTTKEIAALWELEVVLAKLRNTTLFHDDDTDRSQTLNSLNFGNVDRIGYGIQGVNIQTGITSQLTWRIPNPLPSNWNPSLYGPPSPQGFFYTNNNIYSAWAGHKIIDLNNTSLIAWENSPFESSNASIVAERLGYLYPVMWNNGISTYQRIPLWNSARWISFLLPVPASLLTDQISVILSPEILEGIQVSDPDNNNVPLDLAVGFHPNLVQQHTADWQALISTLNSGDTLALLPYNLISRPDIGKGYFELNINLPTGAGVSLPLINKTVTFTWPTNYFLHLCLYTSSNDYEALRLANDSRLGFNTTFTNLAIPDANKYFWNKKNFFNKDIANSFSFDYTGIQDPTGAYLIANNRHHFILYDGDYSEPQAPKKYNLPVIWDGSDFPAPSNNFEGFFNIDINSHNAIPVLMCVKTKSTAVFDQPNDPIPLLVFGPQITPEFFPDDWNNSPFFPPVPEDFVEIARFILVQTPGVRYDVPAYGFSFDILGATFSRVFGTKISVAWFQQTATNFAIQPLIDENLTQFILPSLGNVVQRYRSLSPTKPIIDLAFILLVRGIGIPDSLAKNRADLIPSTTFASRTFRGQLKNPTRDNLKGTPMAILFSDEARRVIYDLAGDSSSAEIIKLNINNLYLTGEKLHNATQLEIFQENNPYVASLNPNAKGTRIAKDYCFRLELRDESENVLIKDWFVLASQFLLTDQEKAYKELTGESTALYYTQKQYESLGDWNQQGYAAVVPNLEMGKSITLYNKVVAPSVDTNGNPVITQDIFEQQLRQQGQTEQQIQDAVQAYIEQNGSFPIINTNRYPNLYTNIRNASISITNYTNASIVFWTTEFNNYNINNFGSMFALNTPINQIQVDSFTIAQDGFPTGSLEFFNSTSESIFVSNATNDLTDFTEKARGFMLLTEATYLESNNMSEIGIQMRFIPSVSKQGLGNSDFVLDSSNYYFIKVVSGKDIKLAGVSLELKFSNTSVLSNPDDYLAVDLYSAIGTTVGTHLAQGSIIKYSGIATTYQETVSSMHFDNPTNQTLFGGGAYYLSLKQSTNPNGTPPVTLLLNRQGFSTDSSLIGIGTTVLYPFTTTNTNQTWYSLLPVFTDISGSKISASLWVGKIDPLGTSHYIPNYQVQMGGDVLISDLTPQFQEFRYKIPYDLTHHFQSSSGANLWLVLEKSVDISSGTVQLLTGELANPFSIPTFAYLNQQTPLNNIKSPVSIASTNSNFSFSYDTPTQKMTIGTTIFDGISLNIGNRVLFKDFSDSQLFLNGIYNLTSDLKYTRTDDFNALGDASAGDLVSVIMGVENEGKTFRISSPNPIAIGNTDSSGNVIFYEFTENIWRIDNRASSGKRLWYKIYGISPITLGSFNREDYAITQQLPPSNNYREKMNSSIHVDGFWNWTIKKLDTPSLLVAYPRAVWNYGINVTPFDFKSPVSLASTSGIGTDSFDYINNILYTMGVNQFDDIEINLGDRVLFKDQVDQRFNGIFVAIGIGSTISSFQRADDFNSQDNIFKGSVINVLRGTVSTGLSYIVTSNNPNIANTSNITFDIYTAQWQYVPNVRDIHVLTRTIKGEKITNNYTLIPAGNITPITITNEEVDGIVYLSIGKGTDLKSARIGTANSTDIDFQSFSANTIQHYNQPTIIDGVTLKHNDRVLVKNYTGVLSPYNGVYRYIDPVIEYTDPDSRTFYDNRRFTRVTDLDTTSEVNTTLTIRVREGTINAGTFWGLNVSTNDPKTIILNITAINFSQVQPTQSSDIAAPFFGASLTDNIVLRSN